MASTLRELMAADADGYDPLWLEAADRLAPWPLFPEQERLLRESGVARGRGGLFLAPTGSGKSVFGEAAVLHALAEGGMAFWLVSTRALAREKARDMAAALGPLGIRVAGSTRDDRLSDEDIRAGRVDVVVTVYEKARALFLACPALRRAVKSLVADECHLLEEPERGPAARLLLAAWREANPQMAVVALTAGMEELESASCLARLDTHRSEERPVPLREGTLDLQTGELRWRCPQMGRDGMRQLAVRVAPGENVQLWLPELAGEFETPVLFCFPTRLDAWQAAQGLIDGLPVLEQPGLQEEAVSSALRDLLARGAGIHTAELSRKERRLVERLLAEGRLRYCVTTTTLAEGVNLPFRTVVAFDGERGWWRPAALRHLFGRAGRPGSGPGLTVLAGHGLKAQPRRIREPNRQRAGTDLELAAMALAAKGPLPSWELHHLLQKAVLELTEDGLECVLGQGRQYGLWDTVADGETWSLLPVGRLLASGGLEPETLAGWRTMLRRFSSGGGEAALLFLALGAASGAVVSVPLEPEERQACRWMRALLDSLTQDSSAMAGYFRDMLESEGHLPRRLHQAAKAVCLMLDWRNGVPPEELSAAYRYPLGLLEDFLDTARFLVGQLQRLGKELGLAGAAGLDLPTDETDPAREQLSAGVSPNGGAGVPTCEEPELIICEGATGEVLVGGREVPLSPRQFRLLELLARRAGEGVPYEHLERHVWPDAQVERQQISYHRRVLERRLREEAGWSGPLIETRPAWGLRLCLGRDRIRFRNGGGSGPVAREALAGAWLNSVAGAVRL